MKNNIYILLCTVFILLMTGCVGEEDDIFPSSSIERINAFKKEGNSILTNSQKGWVMEYFADSESDGFTLLLKFDAPDRVTAACQNYLTNHKYAERSSLYDIIADDGPVLTFNTYNDVIHLFSDPNLGSYYPLGIGLGGDYEFKIKKQGVDSIHLKGRKRETSILLSKFPDGMTWENYFKELDDLDFYLFSKAGPALTLNTGVKKYIVTGGYDHIFKIVPEDESESENIVLAPFIVTRTGVKFSSTIDLDGVQFKIMNLSEDKSALVSADNKDIRIMGPDLNYYFYNSKVLWLMDDSQMSAKLQERFKRFVESCKSTYKATQVVVGLKRPVKDGVLSLNTTLTVGRNKIIGNNNLEIITKDNGKISLEYKGDADANGLAFYNNVDGLKDLINMISGELLLSSENTFNPTTIKFQHIQSTDIWFSVSY